MSCPENDVPNCNVQKSPFRHFQFFFRYNVRHTLLYTISKTIKICVPSPVHVDFANHSPLTKLLGGLGQDERSVDVDGGVVSGGGGSMAEGGGHHSLVSLGGKLRVFAKL